MHVYEQFKQERETMKINILKLTVLNRVVPQNNCDMS